MFGQPLFNVLVHVVVVHFFDGQLLLLVGHAVGLGVCIFRQADALIHVLGGPGGRDLYARGPGQANGVVHVQGFGNVAPEVLLAEEDAEGGGVLDRHTGALGLVRHHRVARVTQQGHPALNYVGILFVLPDTPRSDLGADLEMFKHLAVQGRVGFEEFLDRSVRAAPAMVHVVPFLAREEAVVREEGGLVGVAAVAGGEDNLVPLVLLAPPVLERRVLGVVDQSELDGLFGRHVRVQTAGPGRLTVGADADESSNHGADAIGADDQVVLYRLAIGESDAASFDVDLDSCMVDEKFGRLAGALFLQGRVFQHGVHLSDIV